VRVYLPATVPLLTMWLAAGQIMPVDGEPGTESVAYAVTPTLRESYFEADLDELEHAAQIAASIGSLELLAADPVAPRRRVVVAVEVGDHFVTPDPLRGRAVVRLVGAVPIANWASALVDDPAADDVVEAAIAGLQQAAAGDEDAQFAIDEAEAHELGWYAVQELRHLFG
jgi:hypothetical protein